jgi:hypothetical protein
VTSVDNIEFQEDDDNCTVIKEMIDRDSKHSLDNSNRINTEAIAGDLVGYQILK